MGDPLAVPLPPALREHVASVAAYDVTGAPGVHRGLPSTSLTLVLAVDEPLDISWPTAPGAGATGWSVASGLHTVPAHVRHGRRQRGVHLALTVRGARTLLGMPASALHGELVSLDDLGAPGPLAALPEALHDAVDDAGRARLVLDALTSVLAHRSPERPTAQRPAVDRALSLLVRGTPVHRVADDVGYGRRHLAALVRRETGLTPRALVRVARFERSKPLVAAAPPGSLADVAARAGYADQSHLSREWGALAGCAPGVWRREEVPSVQDGALAAG